MLILDDIINHCRNRSYMSGVARDDLRVKATGEVFTPTPLVQEVLDNLDPALFDDINKTFIDPSCGDGQFLSEVLIRKLERRINENRCVSMEDFRNALQSVYGVELMIDNAVLCRDRLLCGQEQFRDIVTTNIVCHDSLTYDYSFNGTDHNVVDQTNILSKFADFD